MQQSSGMIMFLKCVHVSWNREGSKPNLCKLFNNNNYYDNDNSDNDDDVYIDCDNDNSKYCSALCCLIWKNRRMRVVDSNKSRILSPCAMRTNSIEIFGCCDYTMASDTFRKYLAKALLSVQNTKTPLKGIFLGYIASWPVLAIKIMLTATCWNHSGVSWEHREMCEKLVPTCIKLYWSFFLLIAFVLSSILQEFHLRSVVGLIISMFIVFFWACLAFESGNNKFVFLSSFLLMCVIRLTLKLTNRER